MFHFNNTQFLLHDIQAIWNFNHINLNCVCCFTGMCAKMRNGCLSKDWGLTHLKWFRLAPLQSQSSILCEQLQADREKIPHHINCKSLKFFSSIMATSFYTDTKNQAHNSQVLSSTLVPGQKSGGFKPSHRYTAKNMYITSFNLFFLVLPSSHSYYLPFLTLPYLVSTYLGQFNTITVNQRISMGSVS